MTTGVLEGFLKGDRCRYDDGSVRNLLQSTVAAVARDITLITLRDVILRIVTGVVAEAFLADSTEKSNHSFLFLEQSAWCFGVMFIPIR